MAYSEPELQALRQAYASGITEVRYDGKLTRYDSGEAMLRRIRVIEAEMAAGASRPRKVAFNTRKGF